MQHFPDNSLSRSVNWEQQALFQISQAHLNLLAVCPRKFQHVYLDQLGLPQTPEDQERLDLGNRFHLLIQQQEIGLPVKSLVQADSQLQRWFDAFNRAPPQMLPGERQSEHRRTLCFQRLVGAPRPEASTVRTSADARSKPSAEPLGTKARRPHYLLVGVYDLLILGEQQAQILDWKTYLRPQNQRWLKQSWQTRLYPYILAETSDYSPEQICMTYWFAESKGEQQAEPHSLTFAYNAALHEQTRQDLTQALDNLAGWLETYYGGGLFPQVAVEAGQCDRNDGEASSCRFAIRCQRSVASNKLNPSMLASDINSIQELPL